jgi:catalase
MPLPDDEKLLALANDLVHEFDAIFGVHPGFRPAHAKGTLLSGTFTPTAGAASLSRAPHFERRSTPVTVRFSDSTGIPMIPDNDSNASPHGFAVRFHLAERVHTDIIGHAADGFPVRTGQEFLEMLQALATSDPKKGSPTPIEAFLGTHPTALKYVQTPKPAPSSFACEQFFGVTAIRFTNKDGVSRHGRYRIVPEAGVEHLSDAAAAERGPNYLFDEVTLRIGKGPISFKVWAQLANDGDVVNDATVHWPEGRELRELGTIAMTQAVAAAQQEQKHIIFDPIPRVDGIEPSDDPLLELRAAVYLISGRRRREAESALKTGTA